MQEKKRLHFTHEMEDAERVDADGNKIVWKADFVVDDGSPLAFCYSASAAFFDKMIYLINKHSEDIANNQKVEEEKEEEEKPDGEKNNK